MQEIDLPHRAHVVCLEQPQKRLYAHVCLYDALGEIDRDALVFGIVDDNLLRIVRLDHQMCQSGKRVFDISAVGDVDELFARRLRLYLIAIAWHVVFHLKWQNAERAYAIFQ